MSKACWEKCPDVECIVQWALDLTEYMPTGETTAEIWAMAKNKAESLSSGCFGPIEVDTKIIETNLPFYLLRRALGLAATEQFEVPIYDCAAISVPTGEK